MNAHELADDAKNIHNAIEALEFVQKAVPMLREQADRIAELEKDLKKYDQLAWDDLNKSKTIWCNCGDSIAADSGAKCGICASTTPQTKPLSDEEIIKIFNQIWNDGGNTNGLMHRFARAIEERYGIK